MIKFEQQRKLNLWGLPSVIPNFAGGRDVIDQSTGVCTTVSGPIGGAQQGGSAVESATTDQGGVRDGRGEDAGGGNERAGGGDPQDGRVRVGYPGPRTR